MRSLILSYFDGLRGPSVFLASPPQSLSEELEARIPGFMDIYDRGFFINVEEGVTIANTVFEIHSGIARGSKELLEVSVVLKEEGLNVQLAGLLKDFLDKFAKYCQQMPDLYLAFYPKRPEATKKHQEFSTYFVNFSEILQTTMATVRETDLSYQALFQKARDGIILIDYANGQFIDANDKAERILGRTIEEIRGKTPVELGMQARGDYADTRKKILRQIHDESMPPFESSIILPENRSVPLECSANKIHIWDRDIVQIIFREKSAREDR